MLHSIIVIALVMVIARPIKKMAIKRLNINEENWIYTPINNADKWVQIVFFPLLVIFIFWIGFINGYSTFLCFLAGMIILLAYRSIMEWIFNKKEKRYVIRIIDSITYACAFISLLLWYQL
ncbi:MAG: DUF4181 domain-containing protein [Firmicutes bacterium]|nr:DUF4181 domain-containing protein [Bacillota bacterium]